MSHQTEEIERPEVETAHQCKVEYHEGFAIIVKCEECRSRWKINPLTGGVERLVSGNTTAAHIARIANWKTTVL